MSILGKIAGGLGKGQQLQGKVILGIIAMVLLSKGFDGLQKALQVRMSGNAVTGEVVQHLTECSARIREEGRWQRFDVPCESVIALRERYGHANVRSYRIRRVLVRFARENGQVHIAKVRPSRKFVSWRSPVGTKVDLVYNPSNPDRIRPQPNWNDVKLDLLFFFGSITVLVYLFWSVLGPLIAWLAATRSSASPPRRGRQSESKPNELIEALQRIVDDLGKSSNKSADRGNARSVQRVPADKQQRPEGMATDRRQADHRAKSNVLQTSQGAVKRMYLRPRNWRKRPVGNPGKYEPGSWFGFAG